MQSNNTAGDMRVALLYQTSHLGGHLKDALKEFGAVYLNGIGGAAKRRRPTSIATSSKVPARAS